MKAVGALACWLAAAFALVLAEVVLAVIHIPWGARLTAIVWCFLYAMLALDTAHMTFHRVIQRYLPITEEEMP